MQVGIGILMDSDVPVHISGLAGSNNGTVRGCRIQSEIVCNDEVCTEPEPAIALQHYAPVAAYNGGTIADCTLQTGVNALGNVYGIVEENYGTVTNCDVDLNTNSCTNVSGFEGDGHSFDDSNTVNISELNNRAGSGGVGNP